jgi:hypothetical protein
MIKYEKISCMVNEKVTEYILATFDDSEIKISIPTDPANSDYQRYLRWLENPEAEQFPTVEVTQ